MKARYNPLTREQRRTVHNSIYSEVKKLLAARQDLFVYRTIAVLCIALHEQYGFGKERLSRLIKIMGNESECHMDYVNAAIGDYILVKRMRQLGLDALADAIEIESEKIEKLEGDF